MDERHKLVPDANLDGMTDSPLLRGLAIRAWWAVQDEGISRDYSWLLDGNSALFRHSQLEL